MDILLYFLTYETEYNPYYTYSALQEGPPYESNYSEHEDYTSQGIQQQFGSTKTDQKEPWTCNYCWGESLHTMEHCPALGVICLLCGGANHFSETCPENNDRKLALRIRRLSTIYEEDENDDFDTYTSDQAKVDNCFCHLCNIPCLSNDKTNLVLLDTNTPRSSGPQESALIDLSFSSGQITQDSVIKAACASLFDCDSYCAITEKISLTEDYTAVEGICLGLAFVGVNCFSNFFWMSCLNSVICFLMSVMFGLASHMDPSISDDRVTKGSKRVQYNLLWYAYISLRSKLCAESTAISLQSVADWTRNLITFLRHYLVSQDVSYTQLT
ncbi:hypothetical protein ACF0H5_017930 [Mactra antiquata]